MGLSTTIKYAEPAPRWPVIHQHLNEIGLPAQLMMIDGVPALPTEEPPDGWREVRLGTPYGMVTVRRGRGKFEVVVWSNADEANRKAADTIAQTLVEVSGGELIEDD